MSKEAKMKRLLSISANQKADVIFITGDIGDSTDRDCINEAVKAVVINSKELSNKLATSIMSIEEDLERITSYRTVCGIRNETLVINLSGTHDNICIATIADTLINTLNLIRKKDDQEYESLLVNVSSTDSSDNCKMEWTPTLSLEEAIEELKEIAVLNTIENTELIKISDAYGRILYENVYSKYNMPPFRTSKKHGYAVLVSDGQSMRQVLNDNNTFPPISLQCGTCVWVKSGAPVPNEATAVVEEKDTKRIKPRLNNDKVYIEIMSKPQHGQNINPIGYNVKKDEIIMKKYSRIGPEEMGVLAASGCKEVVVAQQLSIGVLSIGNNLEEPGKPLKLGYVYDINRLILISLLKNNDFSSLDLGIVNNISSFIRKNIEEALHKVDILVTTGFANDKDLLKKILVEDFEAAIHFGNVNIKPGKSTTLATCKINGKIKIVLCLSGNPVTAFIAAQVFLLPLLRKMSGNIYTEKPYVPVYVNDPFIQHHRPRLVCTYLKWSDKDNVARTFSMGNLLKMSGNIFKDRLCNIVGSNALILLPASTTKWEPSKNGRMAVLLFDCPEKYKHPLPNLFNIKKE
ncbi:PREDICTED: gephyrin-like [Cyphomyrmex costatus]|uniref:gephyrin-like n=1 Tax=Cyphomyrmex costatus TaxID=456900 RepID=UPI000852401F|nr:PREDICTED: gephyrin-like [Cyphomyrmex costatus]